MLGTYTGMQILEGSHLSFNTIRNKLTPQIGAMIPLLVDELDHALSVELPSCEDWRPVDLSMAMTRIISRLTSRTWVGSSLSRDDGWHSANLYATANIFYTALILKCLPSFLQPVVGRLLPTRWRLQHGLRRVQAYLVPMIEERKRRYPYPQDREGDDADADDRPQDVLQWMLDAAEGEECESVNLATRYVFSVIGSLYTVSAGLVDCVYDVIARPEYLDSLRDEVRRVLAEDGGWKKGTPAKLVLMDSFMKESQRFNAPSPSWLPYSLHSFSIPISTIHPRPTVTFVLWV